MDDHKKRCCKTTRQQYMLYLEELESNECFRHNKFSPETPNIIDDTWRKLTIALNSTGGPQKDTAGWKKIFADWKSSVKKRARQIQVSALMTGGGPREKPLSDLEDKLINLLGKVTITGMSGVPEIGLENNEQPCNLQPPEDLASTSTNEVDGSSTSENPLKRKNPEQTKEISKSRKNNTLFSSLQNVLSESKESGSSTCKMLERIDNNLQNLVKIRQKKYNLELLKLKLKYPNIELCIEDDD